MGATPETLQKQVVSGGITSKSTDEQVPDLRGQVVPTEPKPLEDSPGLIAAKKLYGDDIGDNLEKLKERDPKLVSALKDLSEKIRVEGMVARRHEIRQVRQARLFWQGIQYGYFDRDSGLWQLPSGNALGLGVQMDNADDLTQQPRFAYVTNYYLAYGLAFAALISQDIPTVHWWPRKPSDIQDITAAKAASEVAELVEQNNNIQDKLTELAYYFWTDGRVGSYVRYVVDGEKFGYDQIDAMGEDFAKMGEDSHVCQNCGQESPASDSMMGQQFCQQCGQPLTDENFKPADYVPVPSVQSRNKVPRGQEVIDFVGALELNTPVWAREQSQFPYLQWQIEVHKAKLKAAYPEVADKLSGAYPTGAEDVYARTSRLSVSQSMPFTQPGDALPSLITFLRTWLRPWSFYDIADKDVRDRALQIFPSGCYMAFAGDVYCEARDEGLDDHWRTENAYPGDGQHRPSVGGPLIDVQDQYNSYANMMAETFEFGIPERYANPSTIDFDALPNTTVEPQAMYPAVPSTKGTPLGNDFYTPDPAVISAEVPQYMQELVGPVAQMLTGLFPAVFGGSMPDVKTAKAYSMARDQAMGRIGLVWRRVKKLYAETMMLSVECFRENRPEDVEIPIFQENGETEYKTIMLTDLKGNIQAYPEPDETFPRLKSDQRSVLQQLMTSDDPQIGPFLTYPPNLGQIKGLLGLTDFVIPGEDSRNKQLREIQELLKAAPVQSMEPDPTTGQMMPQTTPTVPIDPIMDDNQVEFVECQAWSNSDDGQKAKIENPQGFANVRAHAVMHHAALQQQMAQAQPQPGAPAPSPSQQQQP